MKFLFLLIFLFYNTLYSESKEIKELKKELKELKKEVSELRKNRQSSKDTDDKNRITNDVQPVLSDEEYKTKSISSVKTYTIKEKGLKVSSLEGNEGKRYAILVGVNQYKDIAISALEKARNDAKIIGKILQEKGSFDQVFIMTDDIDIRTDTENLYPSKLNIQQKVESLLRNSNENDLIVFFFSGHGISDYEENAYLVTVDTVYDRKFDTALKVEWLVDELKKYRIKKSLLILDACRERLYSSKSLGRDSLKEKYYSEAELGATFYSTKSGYYSYEDDETDFGVFTKYLVYGMEGKADVNSDGVVTFTEIEMYVQTAVREWSLKKNKFQKPYTKINGEKNGDLALTISDKVPQVGESLADKRVKTPSKIGYVWRSSLFPGWGQISSGATYRGIGYSLFFLGSAGLYASSNSAFKSAQSQYNSTPVLFSGDLFLPSYMLLRQNRSSLQKAESYSRVLICY